MSQTISDQHCLWPYPRMIVHRAGGVLAPENTLAAFDVALKLRCKAVEIDVMMTSDGALVLSHDEELGRAVVGCGRVAEMTKDELFKLDAGVNFGEQWKGQKMMAFEDALAFCHTHDIFMNIEIKPAAGHAVSTAQSVSQALDRFVAQSGGRFDDYLISSFCIEALKAFRLVNKQTACGWLVEEIPDDWLQKARTLGVKTIHPDHATVAADFVRQAHDAGFGLMVYTVDDVARAQELLDMGVDAVCTNRPDLLASITNLQIQAQ